MGTFNTVQLQAGTIDNFQEAPNTRYVGAGPGKTIIKRQAGKPIQLGDNCGLQNLTVDGSGVKLTKNGMYVDNALLQMLEIKAGSDIGVSFEGRVSNTVFDSLTIRTTNFAGYGYGYKGLTMRNIDARDCGAGFHVDAQGDVSENGQLLVDRVDVSGAKGMGLEFQGAADGFEFVDCIYTDPNLSPDFHKNDNSMGFSLILPRSKNGKIHRMKVKSLTKPDGTGCRIGYELGGDNVDVFDCYCETTNAAFAMNDGEGTASVNLHDCLMVGSQQIQQPFANAQRKLTVSNVGPDVKLTWDKDRDARQLIPGAFPPASSTTGTGSGGNGGTTAPPTTTDGSGQGGTVATGQGSTGLAIDVNIVPDQTTSGTVTLKLVKNDVGAKKITLKSRATKDLNVTSGAGPTLTFDVDNVPAVVNGFHPGWEVDIAFEAMDASDKAVALVPWKTLPRFPGDPNTPAKSDGGGTTGSQTPPTTPGTTNPATFAVKATIDSQALTNGTATVDVDNKPAGATQYRIETRASMDHSVTDKAGPTGIFHATNLPIRLQGFHPGWESDIRLVAMDDQKKELGTTPWLGLPRFPGDPARPFNTGSTSPPILDPAPPVADPLPPAAYPIGIMWDEQDGSVAKRMSDGSVYTSKLDWKLSS